MRVWMARAAFSLRACRAINVRRMRASVPRKKHCSRTAALVARNAWVVDKHTIESQLSQSFNDSETRRGGQAQINDGLCDDGLGFKDWKRLEVILRWWAHLCGVLGVPSSEEAPPHPLHLHRRRPRRLLQYHRHAETRRSASPCTKAMGVNATHPYKNTYLSRGQVCVGLSLLLGISPHASAAHVPTRQALHHRGRGVGP